MSQEPRTKKAEDTKRRIIDAAYEIFAQHGFYGSRVDEIARTAGVNKASIYYYFTDKEGLYAAVLGTAITRIGDAVEQVDTEHGTMEERLTSFAGTFAAAMVAEGHLAPIMLRELATGAANLPDSIAPMYLRVFQRLRSIIDACIDAQCCRDVHPLMVHLFIVGSTLVYATSDPIRSRISALVPELADRPLGTTTEDAAAELARLIARGLTSPNPAS